MHADTDTSVITDDHLNPTCNVGSHQQCYDSFII